MHHVWSVQVTAVLRGDMEDMLHDAGSVAFWERGRERTNEGPAL